VVLDESLDAVADGNNAILLDEVGSLTLEEGLGSSGLIGDNCIDHGDLLSVPGLDLARLCRHNLHIDVIATPGMLDILHFDELGHS
jgi:hypothetical protein